MADKYNLGAVQQGVSITKLWEGKADSVGEYQLSDSIKNYKLIIVIGGRKDNKSDQDSMCIVSDSIVIKDTGGDYTFSGTSNGRYSCFLFS